MHFYSAPQIGLGNFKQIEIQHMLKLTKIFAVIYLRFVDIDIHFGCGLLRRGGSPLIQLFLVIECLIIIQVLMSREREIQEI